jgi:hypothetical protein
MDTFNPTVMKMCLEGLVDLNYDQNLKQVMEDIKADKYEEGFWKEGGMREVILSRREAANWTVCEDEPLIAAVQRFYDKIIKNPEELHEESKVFFPRAEREIDEVFSH